jgi:hypothetical protein
MPIRPAAHDALRAHEVTPMSPAAWLPDRWHDPMLLDMPDITLLLGGVVSLVLLYALLRPPPVQSESLRAEETDLDD